MSTPKAPPSGSTAVPARILVVEDDRDILDALTLILDSQGYDVLALSEAPDVRRQAAAFAPALILLDIWVGGGDGRELARWFREQAETATTPIVMVSANISTPQIARELTATDFILKPFDVDHLLAVVSKHIGVAAG